MNKEDKPRWIVVKETKRYRWCRKRDLRYKDGYGPVQRFKINISVEIWSKEMMNNIGRPLPVVWSSVSTDTAATISVPRIPNEKQLRS